MITLLGMEYHNFVTYKFNIAVKTSQKQERHFIRMPTAHLRMSGLHSKQVWPCHLGGCEVSCGLWLTNGIMDCGHKGWESSKWTSFNMSEVVLCDLWLTNGIMGSGHMGNLVRTCEQTDRQYWKYYLPSASLASGNKFMPPIRRDVKRNCYWYRLDDTKTTPQVRCLYSFISLQS